MILKHLDETNQRQADQSVGVVAAQVFEQGDAAAFNFEAPRRMVRPVSIEVALDLFPAQCAELDLEQYIVHLRFAGARIQQAKSGVKKHCFAAALRKLGNGVSMITGFAQYMAIQHGHLVRTDDECVRKLMRQRTRFAFGQPRDQFMGWLTGPGRLVDFGRFGSKGQAKFLQQLPAIRGA